MDKYNEIKKELIILRIELAYFGKRINLLHQKIKIYKLIIYR
jgi:hypothetical protein